MKSAHIKQIFKAFSEEDRETFIIVAHEVIQEEERKNHSVLAQDLRRILEDVSSSGLNRNLYSKRYKSSIPIPRDQEKGFPLLEIKESYYSFSDLIVESEVSEKLRFIVKEHNSREVILTYGLKPIQKVLFCGPPGTGKTLSSYILSSELTFPLVYIRFDSIISSYLGQTATNLRKIFDFIETGEWVVLFDEFDVIGKKRDDPDEHGEIKRVVNNFMQMLDNYNGKSLIVAATNHQHLLDTAIWRRFDDIIFFALPDFDNRKLLYMKYLKTFKTSKNLEVSRYAELSEGFSPADIALVCQEAMKYAIIKQQNILDNNILTRAINNHLKRKDILRGSYNGNTI